MTVQVHGAPVDLAEGATIVDLLAALGRKEDGLAIAVNLQVIPRTSFGTHVLNDGDRIDLVTAVGGG